MPIRSQDDTLSRVKTQEAEYFMKQDKSVNYDKLNRFIYHTPGNKAKFFDFRLDFNKHDFKMTTFLIAAEKFVNRPDAISYEVYGNSKFWWIIAMANDVKDPFFEFYKGRTLKIPNLEMIKNKLMTGF